MTDGTWKKPFLKLFIGQAFSIVGSNVVQFAITLWLVLTTGSPILLTAAMLAGYLPQVILGPFAGILVDRYNRKTVMYIADTFVAVASASLMLYFFLGEPPFWFVFVILMLRSVGQGFHEPSLLASIPMIVPQNQLTRVGGYRQAVDSVALIAAPSIAAMMLSFFPIGYIMTLDVLGALIANSLLFFIIIPKPPTLEAPLHTGGLFKGIWQDMKFGVHELAKHRGLIILAIALACAAFIYVPITSLFALLVTNDFGGSTLEITAVQVAFGIGMLTGSLLLGLFDKIKKRVLFMCVCLVVMGFALIVSTVLRPEAFIFLVALAGLGGLGFPVMTSPFFAMLQTIIHPSVLGRVTALVKSVTILATPLGLIIAGPVSELFGVKAWFLFSGIFIVVLGFICMSLRSIRELDNLLAKLKMEKKVEKEA